MRPVNDALAISARVHKLAIQLNLAKEALDSIYNSSLSEGRVFAHGVAKKALEDLEEIEAQSLPLEKGSKS